MISGPRPKVNAKEQLIKNNPSKRTTNSMEVDSEIVLVGDSSDEVPESIPQKR